MLLTYLKIDNLEDPDMQYFTPEKKMAKVFVEDKIQGLSMPKHIGPNLFPKDLTSKTSVMRCLKILQVKN